MKPFLPVPDPVAFTLFGMDIMWYAVLITTGIALGTLLCCKRAPKYGFTEDNVIDLVLYCLPVGIIGARAYYVAFEWENYRGDFMKIINIRGGGLAIHGGLLFGLGLAAIIVKKHRQKPLDWMDLLVPGIALGQAIGRWGNYFNSEAHGGPCDLPWAIECQGELVHPTFLYESIWCFLIFAAILVYEKKHGRSKFSGQFACFYAFFYSLERYFVEGLRTDSLYIGTTGIRVSQALSLVLAVFAGALLLINSRRKHDPADMFVNRKIAAEEITTGSEE